MKYIRNDDGFIAFLDDDLHEITDEDLPISDDFYLELLRAQEKGLDLNFECAALFKQQSLKEIDALKKDENESLKNEINELKKEKW